MRTRVLAFTLALACGGSITAARAVAPESTAKPAFADVDHVVYSLARGGRLTKADPPLTYHGWIGAGTDAIKYSIQPMRAASTARWAAGRRQRTRSTSWSTRPARR